MSQARGSRANAANNTPAPLQQALAGRRVLDLSDEKGVYCTKLFADMGADVIKIESPGGSRERWFPPFWKDEPGEDRSLFFLYMNTNKRGITLDLFHPSGKELFQRLTAGADLIVDTSLPETLEHLGLDYPTLESRHPELVLTSITGFGQTGPHSHYQTSDLVSNAMGGSLHVVGEEADPPVSLAGSQAYVMASTTAAASSMIALLHASSTGHGQHVDISIQESVLSVTSIAGVGKWLDDDIVPKRYGSALFASVPSGAYPCRDGKIYLMINRPLHWEALSQWIHEVTGNKEVLDPMFHGPSSKRQPYRELLDLFISELTQQFSVEQFYREGQRRHLAVSPINTAETVTRDAHLVARDFFVTPEDCDPDEGLTYPGAPYKLEKTPWRLRRSAPRLGQHNAEIYCDELGLSLDELFEYQTMGVI